MIGKIFREFSNDWKKTFQSLENFFPAWFRRLFLLCEATVATLGLLAAWYWRPVTTEYRIDTAQGGETIRLALVADLHSGRFGKNQSDLIRRLEAIRPDAVLLGGDIFDDRIPDDNTLAFLDAASARWPCYYVSGNHEYWSRRIDQMKAAVRARGIPVLEGDCIPFECRGRTIVLCGIDDPTWMPRADWLRQLDAAQASAAAHPDRTRILLTHRPEKALDYANRNFDLVLSGHAHGGQMALPLLLPDGLYAPNQGWFPECTTGRHDLPDGTPMLVTRGLSRERHPYPRWFNPPEILAIDLR